MNALGESQVAEPLPLALGVGGVVLLLRHVVQDHSGVAELAQLQGEVELVLGVERNL